MEDEKLIFANLLNGVPAEQVARDFRRSPEDVERVFQAVLRKVKSWAFIRARGYKKGDEGVVHASVVIVASTVAEARRYRVTCLEALEHVKLEKPAVYKEIHNEVVTEDNALAVTRNLNT